MGTILLVDDDPFLLEGLLITLRNQPHRVLTAASAAEGLERLSQENVDVVVADEVMPGMCGSEFLAIVARRYPNTVRITLTVVRNEYKYVAEVDTVFGDLPLVSCHGGDMNQVFLNLIVNAAHAIEAVQKSGENLGRIRIQTWCENGLAVIAISDTGCGIPEPIQHRIFDPFFTTKEVGRGTGQGLSMVRTTVVDKHAGSLNFDTEAGRGTTFFVRIPIDTKPVSTGVTS